VTGSVTIRPCRPEEGAAVLSLWQEEGVTPSPTDDLDGVRRLMAAPHARLLVAVADGLVVGTVIGAWDGWRGNVYRLAVRPEARRQGIGRALVQAADEFLTGVGARRVSALVDRGHPWAVAFWDSLQAIGYERDPKMGRYVRALPAEPE
jgi:ribosomal protein S18 acetylase RimI-like enzyme